MSTRCNIRVALGSTVIYLYRHHDGYPASTGADLAQKLAAASKQGDSPSRFVESLLAERYGQQSYESSPRPVYELTTEVHADIEWAYAIRFCGGVRIGACNQSPSCDVSPEQLMSNARARHMSLERFVIDVVNPDIRASNVRLTEVKARNPGGFYRDCEPQPEVTLGA